MIGPFERPAVRASREALVNDFQVFELRRALDRFATDFDDLPELIPGRAEYCTLMSVGCWSQRFVVVGLAPDGAAELIGADIALGAHPQE